MRELLDALDRMITELYWESMESSYTAAEQERLRRAARALRRQYAQLARMQFDEHTSGYTAAATALTGINRQLQHVIDRIGQVNQFLDDVGRLAAAVDEIVQAAVPV